MKVKKIKSSEYFSSQHFHLFLKFDKVQGNARKKNKTCSLNQKWKIFRENLTAWTFQRSPRAVCSQTVTWNARYLLRNKNN